MLHATFVGPLVAAQLAFAPPPVPMPVGVDSPTSSVDSGSIADETLAAEAPQPDWVDEGGSAAHAAGGDAQAKNHSMRRAARTTIAGGAIAVLGIAGCIAASPLYVLPPRTLDKLRDENDGNLPAGDPKRQRAVAMSEAAPFVLGVSAGLVLVGTVVAVVAGRRFKKMREEKRTSTVAFGPGPRGLGWTLGLGAQVRF